MGPDKCITEGYGVGGPGYNSNCKEICRNLMVLGGFFVLA